MGFTFDDSGPADDDTPGIPSPIATMERLIAEIPKNAEVIFPYIGGEEVNSSPTHAHHRYVINFGERCEEECRQEWPELLAILERKAKPARVALPPKNAWNKQVSNKWWLFGADRKELSAAITECDKVLANLFTSQFHSFARIDSDAVFANTLNLYAFPGIEHLAVLQAGCQETWAKFMSTSLEDRIRYTPTDCFETFPFPASLLDTNANDPAHEATR